MGAKEWLGKQAAKEPHLPGLALLAAMGLCGRRGRGCRATLFRACSGPSAVALDPAEACTLAGGTALLPDPSLRVARLLFPDHVSEHLMKLQTPVPVPPPSSRRRRNRQFSQCPSSLDTPSFLGTLRCNPASRLRIGLMHRTPEFSVIEV